MTFELSALDFEASSKELTKINAVQRTISAIEIIRINFSFRIVMKLLCGLSVDFFNLIANQPAKQIYAV